MLLTVAVLACILAAFGAAVSVVLMRALMSAAKLIKIMKHQLDEYRRLGLDVPPKGDGR